MSHSCWHGGSARLTRALLHYAGRTADALTEVGLAMRLEPSNVALRRQAKRLRNIIAGPLWSEMASVDTPHYTLRAEVPRSQKKGVSNVKTVQERLEKLVRHLEAARETYPKLLPGKAAPLSKPVIYIFSAAEGYYVYADFTQEDRLEYTLGCYLPTYRQLLFFEGGSEEELLQTMAHEAFHEYLHAVAPEAPIWFNEGMAEYASSVTVQEGKVTEQGLVLKGRLSNLQAALNLGWPGVPFDLIPLESQEQFYGYAPSLQYAQAWSMIHFFRHYDRGRYAPLFERYVRLLGEGKTAREAYREVFEKADLARMHKEWLVYVRTLR